MRKNIAESKISREEGMHFFGLDPAKKTVLVTGGSLGAKTINETIAASIDQIVNNGLQLVWQNRKTFYSRSEKIEEKEE